MLDLDNNTALMMTNKADIGDMLISAGADVNAENNDGKTALMLKLESIYCNADLVHSLIKNNAQVSFLRCTSLIIEYRIIKKK